MNEPVPKNNEFVPTQKLRHFCQVLSSQEVMGNKDKAMKLSGVNKALFYYNLHKKVGFDEWFKRQCAEALLSYLPQICYSTVKTAMNGDHSAQKTLLEMAGLFRPKDGAPGTTVNVNLTPDKTIVFRDIGLDNDEQSSSGSTHAIESGKGNQLE